MINKRLKLLMVAILLIFLSGSIGYYIIFGGTEKFIDCVYMTVISLTSVGYGEVFKISGNITAQVFTMVLITFGMGIILYALSSLTALLIEGELRGILRKNKMKKQINKIKNHYIVCGGGRTGTPLLEELIKSGEEVVLIELDTKKLDSFNKIDGLLSVEGDATDDQNLMDAGIEKAAGILITLPSDKDNLFVTMSARMLNKKIRIITRMNDQKLEAKMKKAGANSVVSPDSIGAMRMASEILRPTVVNFLDTMLRSKQGVLRIHELNVSDHSTLAGKKISESGLKDKFELLILGLKENNQDIIFNPLSSHILETDTKLIVLGKVADIARLKSL
ncbi:MAG: potassium channel protein [Deltaproteobacteria bacterium]|nr:potassium channel protein [Deltaproteobacteria bacterium]